LVCRMDICMSSSAAMVLISCPGRRRDRILIMASAPSARTSMSARHDLFSATSSRSPAAASAPPASRSSILAAPPSPPPDDATGNGRLGGKNAAAGGTCVWWCCWVDVGAPAPAASTTGRGASPDPPYRRRRFCDSRHWISCSSSLMNSMAPPMMDAWSPCSQHTCQSVTMYLYDCIYSFTELAFCYQKNQQFHNKTTVYISFHFLHISFFQLSSC
jgi:hypothetical protein